MTKNTIQLDGIYAQGYGIVPRLVMEDSSIDVGAKCFYAYLCTYAGTGGSCYPSRDKICQALHIGKGTICVYTEQLVKAGYIRVEQVRENGRFCRNVYVLNCSAPLPCTEKPCTEKPCTEKPCTENADSINTSNINNIYNTPYTHYSTTLRNECSPQGENPPTTPVEGEKKSGKGKGKKKSEFIPPTLGEVIAYCASRGNKVDPQKFYDYYDASGWVDGKGNPVRNWKQKCITWERNDDRDAPMVNVRVAQTANAQVPVPPALSESELDELFGFEMPGKKIICKERLEE